MKQEVTYTVTPDGLVYFNMSKEAVKEYQADRK